MWFMLSSYHSVFNMRANSWGQNQLVEHFYNFLFFSSPKFYQKKKIICHEENRLKIVCLSLYKERPFYGSHCLIHITFSFFDLLYIKQY